MRIVDYLDKGASLGPDATCIRSASDGTSLSYGDVQELSQRVADALARSGVTAGDKVAILSPNNATAFAAVFGISRAGAVWCPINPRNMGDENRQLLELFDCTCLIFHEKFAAMAEEIGPRLPRLRTLVSLSAETAIGVAWQAWLADGAGVADKLHREPPGGPSPTVMMVGTGGTTGLPKGVQLTGQNIETMAGITLMSYPFEGRPRFLAFAPLTHAAGVLCFPILALGGSITIMQEPEVERFLRLIEEHRITHTFMPPTAIYSALDKAEAIGADVGSLQCFWYGAAPMSPTRLVEAIETFGPVMAQLFGQSEAPMMVSTKSPCQHFGPDGAILTDHLSSAGYPSPLTTVAIMDDDGDLVPTGSVGEVVVRGSLVMPGYYKDPVATEESRRGGWHHTGDVGYLTDDNELYIVDRIKDVIITGGFNVYSAEVEAALTQHPRVKEAAVVGVLDDKWGERVTAVVVAAVGGPEPSEEELIAFVKARIGSVKAPKQIDVWGDLPRSTVGKILKTEIRERLASPDAGSRS